MRKEMQRVLIQGKGEAALYVAERLYNMKIS